MDNLQKIGERIKKQRLLLGYSREELAEKAHITPRFCYDLELGLKGMSLETLCNLKEALNLSTDYILFGSESEKGENTEYIAALLETCPPDKRSYLADIISKYLQAVNH